MVMVLKPKSDNSAAVVPDGTYQATLSKVSQFENAYGQRIGFEFTLSGKGVDGMKVMRSTSPVLSAKGKLAEVLTGLMGRELTQKDLSSGVGVVS